MTILLMVNIASAFVDGRCTTSSVASVDGASTTGIAQAVVHAGAVVDGRERFVGIRGGEHDFKVWKSDLYHFAQLLFRKEH